MDELNNRFDISETEPKEVFKYFNDIVKIPRASGDEKAISDYLVDFAKKHGLFCCQDDAYNVLIRKPASRGYEDKDTVIIQSHIDMVCVSDDDEHCPEKDGVKAYVDGDYIKAEHTTLGADDGIGVAFALALLADKYYEHPEIEAVFTTSEEVGLLGAKAFDISLLKGRKMINIDTEEEGNLVIGCAGGCSSNITFDYEPVKKNGISVKVSLNGLTGGHSGCEIQKNRANSNILMGRLLKELSDRIDFGVTGISGGSKDNAICVATEAMLIIQESDIDKAREFITDFESRMKSAYQITDAKLKAEMRTGDVQEADVLAPDDFKRLINIINLAPAGIIKRRQSDMKYIETSLNLGVLNVNKGKALVTHCVRSNLDDDRSWLKERLVMLADITGADISFLGEYPAWDSRSVSDFAKKTARVYNAMFGKQMNVYAEHAGLECALFYSKMPDLKAISIGPEIMNAHTSNECVSVSSVGRMWNFFLGIIKE